MSVERVWFDLRFPYEVTTTQVMAALLALSGLSRPQGITGLVLQAVGTAHGVSHQLAVEPNLAEPLMRQLRAAIPGMAVEPILHPEPVPVDRAWRGWVNTNARSLRLDDPEVLAQGLLTALAGVTGTEQLLLRWQLGPVRRPQAVGTQISASMNGHVVPALLKAPFVVPGELDAEARGALRLKQALPGWRAVLHVGVCADGVARQRQLLGQLAAAARVAQAPGIELGFRPIRPEVVRELRRIWRWRLTINVGELTGFAAWPIGGAERYLPVTRVRSRQLPPTAALARRDHVLVT